MRLGWGLAVVLVAVVGCSSSNADPPMDGGLEQDGAVLEDAGEEPGETDGAVDSGAAVAVACTKTRAEQCHMTEERCGAGQSGYRYVCWGGDEATCPKGDVGTCVVESPTKGPGSPSLSCCTELACVRELVNDSECRKRDSGTPIGWLCPVRAGKVAATPPGACDQLNPIAGGTDAVPFCCDD